MITYSKKVSDSVVLPQINQTKAHSKSVYGHNSKSVKKGKSFGTGFSLLAQNTENLEDEIDLLKKSVAKTIKQ